ncbi:NAD(P)/FAD-dependent oxidoreductase [Segeticoccus rhizosphaerae]|uniref:NAD(P)/FAD-dependent oxidoreductase n=1 Tax=Segeticoccus rhizosphaerae TaxID=1104777 RepID=UPI0013901FAD|nr:FAD-dependent oxidoreductase [Ornithinicoccus soli]
MLIVGASIAGVSVAESLRQLDQDCEILLAGEEASLPYDRPPLSKQLLAKPSFGANDCQLRSTEWFAERRVAVQVNRRAVALEPAAKQVTFADGSAEEADHVVITTGARPRRLQGWQPSEHIVYLRTLRDGVALRRALRGRPGRLVVIGAGFVGLEVASAAASLGWSVTVLEATDAPLSRVLPPAAAAVCVEPLHALGVEFRCGTLATGHVRDSAGIRVQTSAGEELAADLALVGAGAIPNTEWVEPSALEVDRGILCRTSGDTSHEGIWSAGDVARWCNSVTGRSDRIEHWQAAREQGHVVARRIAGQLAHWDSPPYFWSDLGDTKIQFVGAASADWECQVVRDGRRALCLMGDDRLRAVLTVSHPRSLAAGRRLLQEAASFEAAKAWAAA